MRTARSLSLTFCLAMLALTASSPAHAQLKTSFQYSVKALCTLLGDIGFGDALSPGRYRTVDQHP